MDKTLFQKIIDREIPATIEFEDDLVIAIRDIQPTAPVHLLVIPKKPIPSVNDLTQDDAALVGHVYMVAQQLAKKFNIAGDGYRVVSNVNAHAGQTVFHLHFHVLGGQPLGRMNSKSAGHGGGSSVGKGILRDAGIMMLAAIGLAIAFNSMNPRAITWMKKEFEHVEATDADMEQFLQTPESAVESSSPPSEVAPAASTTVAVDPKSPDAGMTTTATKDPTTKAPATTAATETPTKPTGFVAQPGVVREVSMAMVEKLLRQPHYLIDARRPEAYANGYIADAVNIYGGEVQGNIPMILEMVPRDRVIIIYCDGGDECELSHHVADVLKQFGYGPMLIYKGGWNEWVAAGKNK